MFVSIAERTTEPSSSTGGRSGLEYKLPGLKFRKPASPVGSYFRIIASLLLCIAGELSLAAERDPANQLRANGNSPSASQQTTESKELEAEIGSLIQATRRVREQIQLPSPQVSESESSGFNARLEDKRPAPPTVTTDVNDIQERIQLLRRLRQRTAAESQSSVNPLGDGQFAEVEGAAKTAATSSRREEPTLSAIEANLEDSAEVPREQNANASPAIQATQILSKPVSHLQLGQSLYQTKNYSAALKALQGVDISTLPESDRAWLELLIALCQRRLGNVDSSEAQLREISNDKSTDYPISVARWWLKQTEIIRDAETILNTNSAELDTLIKRSREHDGQ